MPKDAVQRLQDIDKSVKTVISIYEIASTSISHHDKFEAAKKPDANQFPENSTSRRLENNRRFEKSRETSRQSQTKLLDSLKKTGCFVTRSPQRNHSRESVLMKNHTKEKPGSAPSNLSSTTTMLCESDPIWLQSMDPSVAYEGGVPYKTRTMDNLHPKGLDRIPKYGVVMTPSKTLQTANDILAKHNFDQNEGGELNNQTDQEAMPNPTENGLKNSKNSGKSKPNQKSDAKPRKNSATHIFRRKKKNGNDLKSCIKNGASTGGEPSSVSFKSYPETCDSENKFLTGISVPLPGNQLVLSPINDNDLAVVLQDNSLVEETFPSERKTRYIEADPGTKVSLVMGGVWGSQHKQETVKRIKEEVWENELSILIEESNEKLSEMKVSKELALDIAKHMNMKCAEITKSKEVIVQKLRAVKEENDNLLKEVKQLREYKNKLQQKIVKTLDSDVKIRDLRKELFFLRSEINNSEKQYKKELSEKQKLIEELQKKRMDEARNELKAQEKLTADLRRLTKDKSELQIKSHELRNLLQDRKTKIQSLEDNVQQLEEELQKQSRLLKIKTETLQETNKELEMIRQNSSDLEDQVKTLRKNIENFDKVQRDLIRQTADYEEQLKVTQECLKKQREENARLKEQLENEKDGLRIKVKIIDDQQQTIKQLKEKFEETRGLIRKNQSLERILSIEREEKLELEEAVQRLKGRKDELKQKVKCLENNFRIAPQEVAKDLQKTQIVLHELENQVQMKQKEWELQFLSLIKEKDQACSVAEFATKKLMETTNEFQRQAKAYKRLQRIFAENLAGPKRRQREDIR